MFFSYLLFLASVHSFTFVAATPEPLITPAPLIKRETIADGSSTDPILFTQSFDYTALPEKVNPWQSVRGPQSGYNRCNSSTEGPDSMCQTLVLFNISDFCLWGSPAPNDLIGNEEAAMVAYCTMKGYGTRVLQDGAITGLQVSVTDAYVQWVGFMNNSNLGLSANDAGGELDPHGADFRGNPLGGVVYSTLLPGANGSLLQVFQWNQFAGDNQFCIKLCFNITGNSNADQPNYCENRYDLMGCAYNMPNNARDNEFLKCDSEKQDVVGVYVQNGTTLTYIMPQTSPMPPYQPRVPASSNCVTYQSTELFGVPTSTSGSATATGTPGTHGSGSSGSSTESGSSPTSTKSSALSSMGFPPAFYSAGLAMIAGIALVL